MLHPAAVRAAAGALLTAGLGVQPVPGRPSGVRALPARLWPEHRYANYLAER